MKSLILDLRNNPGGLLPQAIKVVSRFIPEGKTVVSVKGRSRYAQSQELVTDGGNIHDFPLVVLINGGSASASEIVAGAIQDYDRGIIVGSDSFGKGLGAENFPAAIWNRFDADNGTILHALRTFAPTRLFKWFDLRLLHTAKRR